MLETAILAPFFQVIRELLKEQKELVHRKYHEGLHLNEADYHVKVLEPTIVIYKDDEGEIQT